MSADRPTGNDQGLTEADVIGSAWTIMRRGTSEQVLAYLESVRADAYAAGLAARADKDAAAIRALAVRMENSRHFECARGLLAALTPPTADQIKRCICGRWGCVIHGIPGEKGTPTADHDTMRREAAAEAGERIAKAIEEMQTFAHGNNPESRAHVLGYRVARNLAAKIARADAVAQPDGSQP